MGGVEGGSLGDVTHVTSLGFKIGFLSVMEHFSFSIIKNCSSADRDFFVSSTSSLAWAFFSSVSAFKGAYRVP